MLCSSVAKVRRYCSINNNKREAKIVIESVQYILYGISGQRTQHTSGQCRVLVVQVGGRAVRLAYTQATYKWQTHMSRRCWTVIHSRGAPPASLLSHPPKHPHPQAVFRPISRTTSGLVTRTSVYSHSRPGDSHESGSAGNDRGATCAATLAPPPRGGGSRPRSLCGSLLPQSRLARLP